jgi:hypothetical protein
MRPSFPVPTILIRACVTDGSPIEKDWAASAVNTFTIPEGRKRLAVSADAQTGMTVQL